jgi:adenosine deaminase
MARKRVPTNPAELAAAREISRTASPFLRNMPKCELHVHIEGTLLPSLRWKLAQRNGLTLSFKGKVYSTLSSLEDSYNVIYNHRIKTQGDDGRPTFFDNYYGGMEVLLEEADFYELAMGYFEVVHRQGVKYAEPFFDPQAQTRRGVPLRNVMEGFIRAKKDAHDLFGVLYTTTPAAKRHFSS